LGWSHIGFEFILPVVTSWRCAMTSKAKFKSDAFEAIHTSASALRQVGAIDKANMRSFDKRCLAAPPAFKLETFK
jgi:putative transcriptional regulator